MVEPAPQPVEETSSMAQPGSLLKSRQRGRKQVFAAAAVALLALSFALFVPKQAKTPAAALTEQKLQGTWALQTIGKTPTGTQNGCPILAQQVTFSNGKVWGTTHILADTPDGTSQMPFPDKSVQKVTSNDEGQTLTMVWGGTYELKEGHRLLLHIGQAQYPVEVRLNPKTNDLVCSHDLILTYGAPTQYTFLSAP